jgi:hypothetical protein
VPNCFGCQDICLAPEKVMHHPEKDCLINKELKRRSRVSGAYSNDQSLLRVAVCIMMDINEDWITDNKYLSLEE